MIQLSKIANSVWTAFNPTISVAGGTAPSYTTRDCSYLKIGRLVIAQYTLTNTTGGTSGSGTEPLFVGLPFPAKRTCRCGSGSAYNGGSQINGKTIYDFQVVSETVGQRCYLGGDSYNISGANQSSSNRYLQFTAMYDLLVNCLVIF